MTDQTDSLILVGLAFAATLALFSATFIVENLADTMLSARFPEVIYPANPAASIAAIRPFGYVAFFLVLVLILCGLVFKKSSLTTTGSFVFFLPTFGYFALTMFMLARIGLLRAMWLPLFDLSSAIFGFDLRSGPGSVNILGLGQIVYLPFLVCGFPLALGAWLTNPSVHPWWNDNINYLASLQGIGEVLQLSRTGFWLAEAVIILGIFVFFLGAFTWLYGRYKSCDVIDFWIYRHSRHPQYLGFLLWSYGILVYTSLFRPAAGGYVPEPSFPWLVCAMLVVGVALHEESMMAKKHGEKYASYREKTSFMLPLPKRISSLLMMPFRILCRKRWPENWKEIAVFFLLYSTILVLLSLPIIWFYPLLFY